jgi:hypothetical protein
VLLAAVRAGLQVVTVVPQSTFPLLISCMHSWHRYECPAHRYTDSAIPAQIFGRRMQIFPYFLNINSVITIIVLLDIIYRPIFI